MEKKVIINVTSLQRNEAGKDEKITLETPGIYGEKDGMKYVSYEETKLAGMEGTTTTLEIHKDHVRLIRDGSFLQEQVYRIGEKNHSPVRDPDGHDGYLRRDARDRRLDRGGEGTYAPFL